MKKTLMTTAVAAVLLLASTNVSAKCPCEDKNFPPPPPPGHEQMHKPITAEQHAEMEKRKLEMEKRLGITTAQKAQLKAIHEKSKEQIKPKIKQLTEAEYELSVLEKRQYNSEKFGVDTLQGVKLSGKSQDQLRNEIRTLKKEIHEIKKANFEASQAVFTEKQKKELQKMREEKMKKMKKHDKDFHPHKLGVPMP